MRVRSTMTALTLATTLSVTSGCSLLPESDPSTLYRLPAKDLQPAAVSLTRSPTDQRLGVAAPEAGHLLSSNRIVVYPEGTIVNVYGGARWHEDTPDLLQARLIEGLQQSQLFASVGSDGLPSDLLLLSELRHFESEYTTVPPSATIQLDVQLVGTQNRAPLAAQSFTSVAQATSTDIADVVDAFGNASDELADQLVRWLAEAIREENRE